MWCITGSTTCPNPNICEHLDVVHSKLGKTFFFMTLKNENNGFLLYFGFHLDLFPINKKKTSWMRVYVTNSLLLKMFELNFHWNVFEHIYFSNMHFIYFEFRISEYSLSNSYRLPLIFYILHCLIEIILSSHRK